jgi:hypothetical protein
MQYLGCWHSMLTYMIAPAVNKTAVDCVWNVMAQAQKPYFVFRRNVWVHLNRRGRQFSRILAADVCASAVVMRDTARSEVVWRLPIPFASFPLTSPPVRHRVPSHYNGLLPIQNTRSQTVSLTREVVCIKRNIATRVRNVYTILAFPNSRIPFHSTTALLWQLNAAGNNKTYLAFHVLCPILTEFGFFRLIFIKASPPPPPISNFTDIRPVWASLVLADRY